jgi:hypothetical protein
MSPDHHAAADQIPRVKEMRFMDRFLALGIQGDRKRPMLSIRTLAIHIADLLPLLRRSAWYRREAGQIEDEWQLARLRNDRPL